MQKTMQTCVYAVMEIYEAMPPRRPCSHHSHDVITINDWGLVDNSWKIMRRTFFIMCLPSKKVDPNFPYHSSALPFIEHNSTLSSHEPWMRINMQYHKFWYFLDNFLIFWQLNKWTVNEDTHTISQVLIFLVTFLFWSYKNFNHDDRSWYKI